MKTKFELTSNTDLHEYAKLLKIPLHSVLNKDLFKNIIPKEGCYIINLQNSYIGDGTHWTALYLNKKIAIYYNSFGISIPNLLLNFVRRFDKNIKIIYSIDQIQTMESIFCGYYCIYFLYFFSVLHKNCSNYGYLLNKHNKIFSIENKYLNDMILRKLFKNIIEK